MEFIERTSCPWPGPAANDERFAIHGAGHGQRDLYVDLHGAAAQRLSVHDRLVKRRRPPSAERGSSAITSGRSAT